MFPLFKTYPTWDISSTVLEENVSEKKYITLSIAFLMLTSFLTCQNLTRSVLYCKMCASLPMWLIAKNRSMHGLLNIPYTVSLVSLCLPNGHYNLSYGTFTTNNLHRDVCINIWSCASVKLNAQRLLFINVYFVCILKEGCYLFKCFNRVISR